MSTYDPALIEKAAEAIPRVNLAATHIEREYVARAVLDAVAADLWDEGFAHAENMAHRYGHVDYWPDGNHHPEEYANPYRTGGRPMTRPHTHGGTDAPECTTCRPSRPTAVERIIARHRDAALAEVKRRIEEHREACQLTGDYNGGLQYAVDLLHTMTKEPGPDCFEPPTPGLR